MVSTALVAFDRWLWRLPGVRHLLGRPVLEGTHWGEIRSEWIDPETHEKKPPIHAALVVKQTFSSVVVSLHTNESRSTTLSAALAEEVDGEFALAGVYRNDPQFLIKR